MNGRLGRTRPLAAAALAVLVLMLPAAATAAPPFPDSIALPSGWQPEGITAGRGTTVFVGSLRATGGIWRGDVRTGEGEVLVATEAGQTVGIDYETRADRLWVAGGETGQVRVYDASTGDLLALYQLSGTGFLNDVVVTRDAVYVTDSFVQQLVVIPLGPGGALPDPGSLTSAEMLLPLTGDIVYDPTQFNVNGIVEWRGWLIVVQSFNGQLFRVDPDTGEAFAISVPAGTAVSGDGLELHGNTLYVVRNFANTVAAFRLDGRLADATLLGTVSGTQFALDIPTTAAWQAGSLWVVNARFRTPPGPGVPYSITRLPSRF